MKPRESSNEQAVRDDLLSQGFASYLDAIAATKEFERLIMKESREALAACLGDLARAGGVPLELGSIRNYRNPDSIKDDAEWNPTYAWVAATIN